MTLSQCLDASAAHLAPRSRRPRASRRRWAQRLAGVGLALGLGTLAHAAELWIPAGDGAALRQAITTANANGESNTIHLAAGTYTLTVVHTDTDGPTGLPSVTSTLTLRGAGADQTILARAPGAPPFRLLHVAATGRLTVHRLTITQGKVEDQEGGGLLNRGTLTLVHSGVRDNRADDSGGGIANRAGTLLLRDSTVSGNHAEGGGGGIATEAGTVTLTRSTLSGNGANEGGGLSAHGSTVTLRQSTVSGNSAGYGGGIYHEGPLVVHQSTVRDNWAEGRGAGIYSAGTLLLRQSTVSGNQAEDGGGLYTEGAVQILASTISGNTAYWWEGGGLKTFGGTVTLQNSTVSGNTAQYGGGGLVFEHGTVTLLHSTVSGNTTSDYEGAGGILVKTSPPNESVVRLRQSLIAGNTAPREAPAPPADCAVQGTAQLTSEGQNLVGAGTGCPSEGPGDLTVEPATIFTAVLGTLHPNGGPTQTHALRPGSPAIDAGGASCPATDQRGVPRPQGAACDIGAVEQEEP